MEIAQPHLGFTGILGPQPPEFCYCEFEQHSANITRITNDVTIIYIIFTYFIKLYLKILKVQKHITNHQMDQNP